MRVGGYLLLAMLSLGWAEKSWAVYTFECGEILAAGVLVNPPGDAKPVVQLFLGTASETQLRVTLSEAARIRLAAQPKNQVFRGFLHLRITQTGVHPGGTEVLDLREADPDTNFSSPKTIQKLKNLPCSN